MGRSRTPPCENMWGTRPHVPLANYDVTDVNAQQTMVIRPGVKLLFVFDFRAKLVHYIVG